MADVLSELHSHGKLIDQISAFVDLFFENWIPVFKKVLSKLEYVNTDKNMTQVLHLIVFPDSTKK